MGAGTQLAHPRQAHSRAPPTPASLPTGSGPRPDRALSCGWAADSRMTPGKPSPRDTGTPSTSQTKGQTCPCMTAGTGSTQRSHHRSTDQMASSTHAAPASATRRAQRTSPGRPHLQLGLQARTAMPSAKLQQHRPRTCHWAPQRHPSCQPALAHHADPPAAHHQGESRKRRPGAPSAGWRDVPCGAGLGFVDEAFMAMAAPGRTGHPPPGGGQLPSLSRRMGPPQSQSQSQSQS